MLDNSNNAVNGYESVTHIKRVGRLCTSSTHPYPHTPEYKSMHDKYGRKKISSKFFNKPKAQQSVISDQPHDRCIDH